MSNDDQYAAAVKIIRAHGYTHEYARRLFPSLPDDVLNQAFAPEFEPQPAERAAEESLWDRMKREDAETGEDKLTAYCRKAILKGGTYKSVAAATGTTLGKVAKYCRDKGIRSMQRAGPTRRDWGRRGG